MADSVLVSTSVVSKNHPCYDPATEKLAPTPSVSAAKAILQQAGYTLGSDGKLQKDGYDVSRDLIAAQNDTVVVSCREGTVRNNLAPVLEHYRVPIQYLSEPPTEWITYQPKSKLLVLDRVFEKQGIQIPKLLMGKNVIHLPTVKTHVFTGTTGAMKNAFGGLLNLNRHWTHSVIHETLVDLLRIQ